MSIVNIKPDYQSREEEEHLQRTAEALTFSQLQELLKVAICPEESPHMESPIREWQAINPDLARQYPKLPSAALLPHGTLQELATRRWLFNQGLICQDAQHGEAVRLTKQGRNVVWTALQLLWLGEALPGFLPLDK